MTSVCEWSLTSAVVGGQHWAGVCARVMCLTACVSLVQFDAVIRELGGQINCTHFSGLPPNLTRPAAPKTCRHTGPAQRPPPLSKMKKGTARFWRGNQHLGPISFNCPIGDEMQTPHRAISLPRGSKPRQHTTTHVFLLGAVLAVGDACSSATAMEGEYHAAMIACWHSSPSRVSKNVGNHACQTLESFSSSAKRRGRHRLRDGKCDPVSRGGDGSPCQLGCRQAPLH